MIFYIYFTALAFFLLVISIGWYLISYNRPWEQLSPISLEFVRSHESSTTFAFTILQLTDIHLGEAEDQDWGPEQDRKSFLALDRILSKENRVDLIVLTGDQLTSNNVDANATAYYEKLGRKINSFGIPWALIFGNHDQMPLEVDGSTDVNQIGNLTQPEILKFPAKTDRRQLVEAVQQFDLSLTQIGPKQLFGVSNYWLDVYFPRKSEESVMNDGSANGQAALRLVFFDSGGGSLPQQITDNQVEWFWENQRRSPSTPIVAFQHIPSKEFRLAAPTNSDCKGLMDEPDTDPLQDYDAGIVSALHSARNVHLLAVGHNHGNDYCCQFNSSILYLCFGRHSGYGGYGRWDRGARVYQFKIGENGLNWKSWVRLEGGDIIDEYWPQNDA